MDRYKNQHDEEIEFEYDPEQYEKQVHDLTELMERHGYDYDDYEYEGFASDEDSIGADAWTQVITIDELEQWKRDDL